MNRFRPQIVFFGSGPVAAESLRLLKADFKIEAVITKPQPAHHRGDFPVETLAKKLKLPVFPAAARDELSKLFKTKSFASRLGVVIDYGVIIGADVINSFPLGIVNSHFSLLPSLRGADPITAAILSGQPRTGVSLMLIDETLDTGKLIAQKSLPLSETATAASLTQDLIKLSHWLLTAYLPKYLAGKIKPRAQPHPGRATYSRKLTKADGLIDWHTPAEQIERQIRAYQLWPKSRTTLFGKEVIIIKAKIIKQQGTAGRVLAKNQRLLVYCGQGALEIQELKPAGKKAMSAQAFLAGYGRKLK